MTASVAAYASLVTGNDDLDDPAYGNPPLWSGTLRDLPGWLRAQASLDQITVTIDNRDCLWAGDFLSGLT